MLNKNSKQNIVIFIVINLLIITLTSCGFELRGLKYGKLNINNINLEYTIANTNNININKLFINQLKNSFNSQNIDINTKNKKNNYEYKLEILNTNYSKNIISTGSNQLIAQYKLAFNTEFNLYYKNKLILKNQSIITNRNYNYRQDQILGLSYQENSIINDLISETIDKIMMQIVMATNK